FEGKVIVVNEARPKTERSNDGGYHRGGGYNRGGGDGYNRGGNNRGGGGYNRNRY
ncbi:MAG TPA: RNA-binding protein, partial [Bacteroidales bacterium]|nr:RNA-binding protein [Bacteroidales bacterium]